MEKWKQLKCEKLISDYDLLCDYYSFCTVHCTDGVIESSSSQPAPETPQPEESKPAPEESKKPSGGFSPNKGGGSGKNNKPAPAPSEPKTEQEAVKETIENLPQGGQAVLETGSVIGSGELRKIMEDGGYVVVNLTHCSDYILTTKPLSAGVANGPVPAAGAGNGTAKGNLDSTPHTGI